jgi:hypothetical protein
MDVLASVTVALRARLRTSLVRWAGALLLGTAVPPASAASGPAVPSRAEFRLLEVGPSQDGGTVYLAFAGDPVKRCAFTIVLGKTEVASGGRTTAPLVLRRHPHADCTALLQKLGGERGSPPSAAAELTGAVAILGRERSRSSPDAGPEAFSAQPPGPWIATELALGGGASELLLNLAPRDGVGEIVTKRAPASASTLAALASVLRPDRPPIAGGKPWQTLTKAEKKRVMKEVVLPRMSDVFRAFDPARYTKVDCTLCHGQRANEGRFAMPNPDLPTLDFANKLRKERAEKPLVAKFMFKHVVPEMTLALGVSPFDTKTGQGFGCQSCHPVKN